MALLAPFEDNEAFEWKKCNTDRQACVACGEMMRKGEIAFIMNNTFDKSEKKQYLWVHAGCVYKLAVLVGSQLETETIMLMKNPSENIGCIECGKKVTKGQIHLKLCNAMDAIRTSKNLWIHRNCRSTFAQRIKGKLRLPQKR